jgi:hypothetical protein
MGGLVRFSELYDIELSEEDDWFDPFLPADTPLCVDPFLIYEDHSGRWATAHGHILDFFANVFTLVRLAKGNQKSNHWRQAERLLLFPEPYEFCLGVAEGSPRGAGSGPGLQKGMLEGIRTAVGLGIERVSHIEMLALFEGGMGLDRISDVTCNILKSYFIEYTQQVCRRQRIHMEQFPVRHASWSDEFLLWQERKVSLPVNPFTKKPQPVLLVPERFLREIPVVTANGFWSYAWQTHADELRGNLNYDIARKVPARVKARLARLNPNVVVSYLRKLEETEHEPYPVKDDPAFIVNWYEAGAGMTIKTPLSDVPSSIDGFPRFIQTVVEAFRHNIEDQDGWQLLWYHERALTEKRVQALFRGCVTHYCHANNIALAGESNAGRGPVDFKFSQGWNAQALVEIKLMRNHKFWDGILAQVPAYARAEGVNCSVIVAVAFTDAEMEPARIEKIHRAAEIASTNNGIKLTPIIIDARPKESASKLDAPADDLDELRGRSRDDGDSSSSSSSMGADPM